MLYRLLLIVLVALGLTACLGADDYETDIKGDIEVLPEPEPEPDPSILINGSLEDGDTSSWTITINDGAADIGVSPEQFFSGDVSLKISIGTVGANPWDIEAGPSGVTVSDQFDYQYTAWVLGTPGGVANFTASLPVDPWTTLGSQRIDIESKWKKVSFKFSVPEGVTEIRLPVQLSQPENEGKDIYIDAISLVPISKTIPPFRPLPVDSGWRASGSLAVSYGAEGVSYSPTAANDQLLYDLYGPETYNGKTFTFEIIADQAFLDSGANLQPIVQIVGGSWAGEWSCWINNGDLSVAGGTFSCTADEVDGDGNPVFDLDQGEQLQVGVQTNGTPAGTITIASWSVDLPPLSDIELGANWNVSDGLTAVYDASGVSYSPTAEDHQLTYNVTGPDDLEGATFVTSISVTQAYIDSGANLQPFAQLNFGDNDGAWGCWINNADLSTSPKEFSCTVGGIGAPFNLADDTESFKFGVQAKGSPAGTVTIHNIEIQYPEIPVDAGWNGTGVVYDGGVTFSPVVQSDSATYNLPGPANYAGATFVFTIAASQQFIDTGSNLQPIAQDNFDPWTGHWSCWINNGDLTTSGAEYSCTIGDTLGNLADGQSMKVGVQTPDALTVAGTVTISKVRVIFAD